MRLTHLHIDRAGILRDVDIDLAAAAAVEGLAYTAIIGPNGSGKTTLLEWVNAALQGKASGTGSFVLDGVQWPAKRSTVVQVARRDYSSIPERRLFVRAVREPRLTLNAPLNPGQPAQIPTSTATNAQQDTSSERLSHVHQWLMHLQLRGMRPRLWEAVAVLFSELHFVEFDPSTHDLIFDDRGHRVGFNQLSAGQRAMITLLGEIERNAAPDGLVLWDEPEAHLHPTLQWNLRKALEVVLPQGQVIVATHSPHVLEGLAPYEVIVLGDVEGDP